MPHFKVICKASNGWGETPTPTKTIVVKKFFGLIKETRIVSDPKRIPGPVKDEICIVTEEYEEYQNTWYTLAGYPFGRYDSRRFIKLDEFEDMIKVKKVKEELN